MAWQACRVETCAGGFTFEPHQMRKGAEKECETCNSRHHFDDSMGRWIADAADENASSSS